MRLASGILALVVGTLFLDNPTPAQVGFPASQPPFDKDFGKKLLADYEKMAQDPAYDVIDLKNLRGSLIRALSNVGPYEKAIELCEEELKVIKERGVYGELASTWVINDLARLCTRAGRHDRAIAVRKEHADWCARHYGEKSADTFAVRGMLVKAYLEAGQRDKAVTLTREIFAGLKQAGEEKLHLLNDLSQFYFTSKDYESYLESILQIMEVQTALGGPAEQRNPSTRVNAAYWFLQAGKKDLAKKLLERDWQQASKAHGPDDPKTLAALRISASEYLQVRQNDRAVALFGELIERLTKQSGADHLDTLTARNQLGEAELAGNDTEKARKIFQELHATSKEKLPADAPLIGQVIYNLARSLEAAKKDSEAEPYYREYIEVQKKVSKAEDTPAVTGSMALLGMNLLKQEKWAEAETVLSAALEIRRKKEPRDWTTNNSESLLGAALLGQKKYKEAEALLLAGYTGLEQKRFYIPPFAQTLRVNEALGRLVKLYEATEQPAKAEQYRKLLRK